MLERELRGLIMRLAGAMKSGTRRSGPWARRWRGGGRAGAEHFGTIISELTTALTRGFELHVLGHTVHHLLAALAPTVAPGDLDGAVPLLMPVLLEDIFGEPAEKREVDAIANSSKEARGTQSFHSFELLGATLGFVPNINLSCRRCTRVVSARVSGVDAARTWAPTASRTSTTRAVLRTLSAGLSGNPTLALQPCASTWRHARPTCPRRGRPVVSAPRRRQGRAARPAAAGTVLAQGGGRAGERATDSPLRASW